MIITNKTPPTPNASNVDREKAPTGPPSASLAFLSCDDVGPNGVLAAVGTVTCPGRKRLAPLLSGCAVTGFPSASWFRREPLFGLLGTPCMMVEPVSVRVDGESVVVPVVVVKLLLVIELLDADVKVEVVVLHVVVELVLVVGVSDVVVVVLVVVVDDVGNVCGRIISAISRWHESSVLPALDQSGCGRIDAVIWQLADGITCCTATAKLIPVAPNAGTTFS